MKYDLIFRGARKVVQEGRLLIEPVSVVPRVVRVVLSRTQQLSQTRTKRVAAYYHSTSATAAANIIQGTIKQDGVGITVGDYAQIKRSFTIEEVNNYGDLIGDNNPIHRNTRTVDHDNDYYSDKDRRNVIVHGMFTSSLFSSIFGTLIPGSMYRSQQLNFVLPVYTDECIIGKVEVTKVKDLRKGLLVTCDTSVFRCQDDQEEVKSKLTKYVKGSAEVWIPMNNDTSSIY